MMRMSIRHLGSMCCVGCMGGMSRVSGMSRVGCVRHVSCVSHVGRLSSVGCMSLSMCMQNARRRLMHLRRARMPTAGRWGQSHCMRYSCSQHT